ncbi:MAG TPA: polysaccharide biosynthesis tyrosine autokinase [Candidatus Limnocylindria bacterium]|jgi:capsular exopolysaccharide synthesis family protein|nr:polysaccharide biosynthesis tyrosine autokinase [Candidatus Limnocylindria bacterium]
MDVAKTGAPQATDNKLHFLDYWRVIRIRKAIIILVFLLVVITTVAVTYMLPVAYSSTARMRVAKDTPDIALMMSANVGPATYDPYYLQTEFEVLKSRKILDEVIKNLNLADLFQRQLKETSPISATDCYDLLSDQLDIKQFRNTEIIEVTAFNQESVKAAAIATEVAKVYQSYREDLRNDRTKSGLNSLTNKLTQWEAKVAEAQKELDRIRIEFQIPDAVADGVSSQGGGIGLGSQEQSRILSGVIDLHSRIAQNKLMVEKLEALPANGDDLRNALSVINPTPELNKLIGQVNETRQIKKALDIKWGKGSQEVKEVDAKLAEVESQLDLQVNGILSALKTQLASQVRAADELQSSLDAAIKKDATDTARYRPYMNAKRDLENLKRIRDAINARIAQEDIDMTISKKSSVEVIDHAIESTKPVKPRKALNITLGVMAGLILGVGLAFFIEYLDTSVKTIDDVEQALASPVLGVIPQNVGSLMKEGPDSPHAEAYRVLRTNILFSRKQNDLRTLTVISGGAGEGKSTTIFNLACIFAQQGNRVLLVDSDLRRPSLHKILNVPNTLGLTNFLLRQNKLEEVVQVSSQPGLDFLPSGKLPSSSMGILNSAAMKEFIAEAKSRYDFVLFDSPPIMGVSDASVLASEVDMAVLVVQYRKYPQQMTLRAKQMIEKVGGNLLGVVLNNINISQDSYYYYYAGYYYDYYSKNEDSKPAEDRKTGSNGTDAKKAPAETRKKY